MYRTIIGLSESDKLLRDIGQMGNLSVEPLSVSASVAAKLLGLSKPVIYQLMKRSDFPAFKVGGRTLVSVAGLRRWVEAQVQTGGIIDG